MHTNALLHEKSPYLRQHAHNPVEWLPWGDQAFDKARRENKPIFLSIGYSTCHWCHVMAHESFENEQVAEVLNRHFVPVKVDREERPDVDRVYMLFVQASTGSGGWPMSVWLTPDRKPFYGGTYFPPDSRYGRPGFVDVLQHLAQAWNQERERIEESGTRVVEQLREMAASAKESQTPQRELFEAGFQQFRRMFDSQWGGFGGAPKFPRPAVLNYLLRCCAVNQNAEALEMVTETLRGMALGGMHDQLGGGFHRYSVDERWFVPHFEKMLYDQSQLAIAYLEVFQVTKDHEFAEVARDIFTYVSRDLTGEEGGFYSAEDADSPDPENPAHSGEGAFYIWRQREIEELLGQEDAALFCRRYGVEPGGNVEMDPHNEFTGRNILYEAVDVEELAQQSGLPVDELNTRLDRAKQRLFEARNQRPRPHLDRKVLTSWNSMMISAYAKGYVVLGEKQYLDAAERATRFLLDIMYDAERGQLLRRFCDGEAAIPGFLDDYAFFAQALLHLFEASSNAEYLRLAVDLASRGLAQFEDTAEGGFFSTVAESPDLVLRMKEDYDGAEPSGNSIATDVLLRLSAITGDPSFRDRAEKALSAFAPKLRAQPTMAPQMAVALGRWLTEPEQIIVRFDENSDEVSRILEPFRTRFAPYSLVAGISDSAARDLEAVAPFLAQLKRNGRITIYECRNFVCELPKTIG